MSKPKTKTKATKIASPLQTGNVIFIRTVTNYFIGRVVGLNPKEILLQDATWVAWTKRWATSLATGELEEVEPYPDDAVVLVNRETVVDICLWAHPIPREQK